MKNFANILTLSRLALLPVIIVLLFFPAHWHWASCLCLILYIIGAGTDFLDGWVARRFDQVTEFGKLLDPIADKIFVVVILVMLIESERVGMLGSLAIIIILIREFTVSGLREFLSSKEIKLSVTTLAKWKTASQMVATCLLIVAPAVPLYFGWLGLICLIGAASLTAITGWQYLQKSFGYLRESEE